mmetsp:Transcript_7941/g.28777  ORF Transcript_7941/g.28777 Transcript_7941/m.28777 type:complete len:278 (+) Transcript_7941:1018-1851(+)
MVRDAQLEPVLARVPRPGDKGLDAVNGRDGEVGKVHLAQVDVDELLQGVGGRRALDGEDAPVLVGGDADVLSVRLPLGEVGVDVRQVLLPVSGVHNKVDVLSVHLGHHGVVDRSALLVHQDAQASASVLERRDVAHDQALDEGDGVLAGQGDPEHMRHVEDAALLPAVGRRVHDRVLVLNRHRVPGEGNHLCALVHVEVVQLGLQQIGAREPPLDPVQAGVDGPKLREPRPGADQGPRVPGRGLRGPLEKGQARHPVCVCVCARCVRNGRPCRTNRL